MPTMSCFDDDRDTLLGQVPCRGSVVDHVSNDDDDDGQLMPRRDAISFTTTLTVAALIADDWDQLEVSTAVLSASSYFRVGCVSHQLFCATEKLEPKDPNDATLHG